MPRRIDDAIIFVNTYQYAQRQIPPTLGSLPFVRLTEKELSAMVVLQRFEKACARLVELAQDVEVTTEGYPIPDALPYARFGNMRGQELLLREIESDWGTLLGNAVTLEDLVCNVALDLSEKGIAWEGCEKDKDGSTPTTHMGKRNLVRKVLRKAYKAANHDTKPLKWVSDQRNAVTHHDYAFAVVVQRAGEVVFSHKSDDYANMDHTKVKTLTAKRLIAAVRTLHDFISWFVPETYRQSSPTLRAWTEGEE